MPTNEGFTVHDGNPNAKIGGQACLATGGLPHEDCDGRWINFFNVQTEYAQSPYAAICEYHLGRVVETYEGDDIQAEVDAVRRYSPITREDTGLPAAQFAGTPGDPEGLALDRKQVLEI